jgi:hypothetical protein
LFWLHFTMFWWHQGKEKLGWHIVLANWTGGIKAKKNLDDILS